MEFNVEALRQELMDYLGTAWASGNPMALAELSEVETAGPEQLIAIAERLGIV